MADFQMRNKHLTFTEFYDVFLCYLASDSYDPEALKELLKGDPRLSAAFPTNLTKLNLDEGWPVAAASKDLNYGFKNSHDLRDWSAALEGSIFDEGPVPE